MAAGSKAAELKAPTRPATWPEVPELWATEGNTKPMDREAYNLVAALWTEVGALLKMAQDIQAKNMAKLNRSQSR